MARQSGGSDQLQLLVYVGAISVSEGPYEECQRHHGSREAPHSLLM